MLRNLKFWNMFVPQTKVNILRSIIIVNYFMIVIEVKNLIEMRRLRMLPGKPLVVKMFIMLMLSQELLKKLGIRR